MEDVSPVPLHDSVWEYIRDYLDVAVGEVNKLLGIMGGGEGHAVYHHREAERRTSVFVQQMREQISKLPLKYINNDDNKSVVLPQLKMNFHMPMSADDKIISKVASELEGAMRDHSTTQPSHGIMLATSNASNEKKALEGDPISCEEWVLPETTAQPHRNSRKLRLPNIYLLTGCKEASVDVLDSDAIVIRVTHTDNDINGLEQYLQAEIAPVLLKIVYPTITAQKQIHRIESVFVQLIDEDPSSHGEGDSKVHFDLLGKALSSSLKSTISPMINDLSFIYGGNVELLDDTIFWKDAIDLSSAPSAYLSLSNDVIEIEVGREAVKEQSAEIEAESSETGENESVSKKFVTTEQMSKFIQRYSSPNEGLEWFLFSPSKDHSPLSMRDGKSGDIGHSIILSGSKPTGVSLVQIDDDDKYINSVSHSLVYLAGYIRELNGLQSQFAMEACAAYSSLMTPVNCIVGSKQRQSISFWELESIAQRHWYSVLQQVLHEIDAVMSLLHEHGSTLALPEHVAKKVNTATHLLRESISFVENGFPAVYATSVLYGALTTIESVQADADLFELSYFALDHYLAVFSPLVLPLIMPMIFGLIKEVKRYNELTTKKQA